MKALVVLGVVLLTALGLWQVQRLGWKRDLVERVEQRVHATPVAAPDEASFDPRADEYRAVTLRGEFLHDRETLVLAATKFGGGFWVLTPLRTDGGPGTAPVILVNRGFVPTARKASRDWSRPSGIVTLSGLLRLTEPGGGFLRDNRPADDRWYSRDVAAISRARGLSDVAPYFVDAASVAPPPANGPVGGLTVVRFSDNHLQYALTWFTLALLLAVGGFRILRR
jgi:surfeit locus 1 family protein